MPTSFSEETSFVAWFGRRHRDQPERTTQLSVPREPSRSRSRGDQSAATAKFTFTPDPDDQIYEVPDETVVVAGTGTDAETRERGGPLGAPTLTVTDND